jgi:L,D-transpeptidase catalytic domain
MPTRTKIICILLSFLFSFSTYAYQQALTKALNNSNGVIIDKNYWLKNSFAYRNAFVFSPRSLTWRAYNSQGRVIRSGRASGGAHYCRDVGRACRTPVGSFRIISKRGPGCRSSRYPRGRGGARMPYCMFFSKYYAIHGSYDVPRRNASHGCIRVHPGAAKWLSHNFIRIGTRVVVTSY